MDIGTPETPMRVAEPKEAPSILPVPVKEPAPVVVEREAVPVVIR